MSIALPRRSLLSEVFSECQERFCQNIIIDRSIRFSFKINEVGSPKEEVHVINVKCIDKQFDRYTIKIQNKMLHILR